MPNPLEQFDWAPIAPAIQPRTITEHGEIVLPRPTRVNEAVFTTPPPHPSERNAREWGRALQDFEQRNDLLTIREVAEIIGKSYHTTRNLALRRAFGDLEDDYITRNGLIAYTVEQADAAGEMRDHFLTIERTLTGRPETSDHIVDDDDVTDEMANIGQAFQNVANAFESMVERVNEHSANMHNEFDAMRAENATITERFMETLNNIHTIVNRLDATGMPTTRPGTAGPARLTMQRRRDRELIESGRIREPGAALRIADDRPDQIVSVVHSHHGVDRLSERVDYRSRLVLNVGDLVDVDENGELFQSNPPSSSAGVVMGFRDAIPDASEVVQPVQTVILRFGQHVEVLHPWRPETIQVRCDETGGGVQWTPYEYFELVSWEVDTAARQTTIRWRGV